jgi:hypothetical protein
MKHSRDSIRRIVLPGLILIALFNLPGVSTHALRLPRSTVMSHAATPTHSESSAAFTPPPAADRQARARVSDAYGRLPLRFEVNAGQTDRQVKFLSRGGGHSLFLTPAEAVLTLRNSKAKNYADRQSVVRIKLMGANPAPQIEGVEALPGKSNYLIGNDPGEWRRNVTSYGKVRYRGIYPGIDLIYYGNQQQLEYDFVVAAGADPNAIKLDFGGARQIQIDAQGDLVLDTGSGKVRQRKAVVYQRVNGRRREIANRYVLTGERQVRFEIASYDRARPLVIDPVLSYSTYLGGTGSDQVAGITVDVWGNAYLTGLTSSLDFPTADPMQPQNRGLQDVFVAKLNREGSALVYATYLGGSGGDSGVDIAVDWGGNAYVTGLTFSPDFPTVSPLQPAIAGPQDGFVAKLNSDGSALCFSTYLGGSGSEGGTNIAVGRTGGIYLVGGTNSPDFPTRNPLQPAIGGTQDSFVAGLKSDGSALLFSTYLGGSGNESSFGLAVDLMKNIYVAGITDSIDFPTAAPLQPTLGGSSDAFAVKLAAGGGALIYSTYLGGNSVEIGNAIALDAAGNAYVTGVTFSTDFPTVNPLQPNLSGVTDAFVAKIDRTGSALCYSTYLGGTDQDSGADIAVDWRGNAYIAGVTLSIDFPTIDVAQPMPDPNPMPPNARTSAFVARINAAGSGLIYSSYLGGGGVDQAFGIAVDLWGNAYVVGVTGSEDLPTTPGAFQREFRVSNTGISGEGFIIKISR